MKFNYSLFACLLLLNCSKSNDPSNVADAPKCLLTGITSDGTLVCTITYASGKIVNVSCENAGRSTDTKRIYDYTYSNNQVSIKQAITDNYGSSTTIYNITLQNQLPIQVSIGSSFRQKLYYDNSKLKYYRTYGYRIDSVVLTYDTNGENIIAETTYEKTSETMKWSTSGRSREFVFDSKTNPLKSIFLIEENFRDIGRGISHEYFNKNNIISSGTFSGITYLYNNNNLPSQRSQPGSSTLFYSYQCP